MSHLNPSKKNRLLLGKDKADERDESELTEKQVVEIFQEGDQSKSLAIAEAYKEAQESTSEDPATYTELNLGGFKASFNLNLAQRLSVHSETTAALLKSSGIKDVFQPSVKVIPQDQIHSFSESVGEAITSKEETSTLSFIESSTSALNLREEENIYQEIEEPSPPETDPTISAILEVGQESSSSSEIEGEDSFESESENWESSLKLIQEKPSQNPKTLTEEQKAELFQAVYGNTAEIAQIFNSQIRELSSGITEFSSHSISSPEEFVLKGSASPPLTNTPFLLNPPNSTVGPSKMEKVSNNSVPEILESVGHSSNKKENRVVSSLKKIALSMIDQGKESDHIKNKSDKKKAKSKLDPLILPLIQDGGELTKQKLPPHPIDISFNFPSATEPPAELCISPGYLSPIMRRPRGGSDDEPATVYKEKAHRSENHTECRKRIDELENKINNLEKLLGEKYDYQERLNGMFHQSWTSANINMQVLESEIKLVRTMVEFHHPQLGTLAEFPHLHSDPAPEDNRSQGNEQQPSFGGDLDWPMISCKPKLKKDDSVPNTASKPSALKGVKPSKSKKGWNKENKDIPLQAQPVKSSNTQYQDSGEVVKPQPAALKGVKPKKPKGPAKEKPKTTAVDTEIKKVKENTRKMAFKEDEKSPVISPESILKKMKRILTQFFEEENITKFKALSKLIFEIWDTSYPEDTLYQPGDIRSENYFETEQIVLDSMLVEMSMKGTLFLFRESSLKTIDKLLSSI